jgi:PAP2 superfamily
LFPNRGTQYQGAYDAYVAALPASDAKTRGLAVGAEVAAAVLALRANDGRMTPATYTPGSAPGNFRGVNPVAPFNPYIRPFTLTSASQFRAPPPPALDSAAYAADFEEVRTRGGATSTVRTADETEAARAHTENPATYLTRNYRAFAMDGRSLADNARLAAMLMVTQADAAIACFETKYYYAFWRPQSAIPLADTDGNAATTADAAWTPLVPTPNHPEYPSAHMCLNGASMAALTSFFGTERISFSFSSTVTGGVRQYATPNDFLNEIVLARISGGMHFRTANVQGGVLGTKVGQWVAANHFQPK